MDRLARATLQRDDFLHNQVLREMPLLQSIFSYLSPYNQRIVCANLRGPREGPCSLLVTIEGSDTSGRWCEEFSLKDLSATELGKLRSVFEKPVSVRGKIGLPAIYVSTRPTEEEILFTLAENVSIAERALEREHAIICLANYCGVAAVYSQDDLCNEVLRELRAAIVTYPEESEKDRLFLRVLSPIVFGAGIAGRSDLLSDLLEELIPPGALNGGDPSFQQEMRELAKVVSCSIARKKDFKSMDTLLHALGSSEQRALLTATVLMNVLKEGSSKEGVSHLLKRVERHHRRSSLPISTLIRGVLSDQGDILGFPEEKLIAMRQNTDLCVRQKGIEGELGELAAWLFGGALGQYLHTMCGTSIDPTVSERAVAVMVEQIAASAVGGANLGPAVIRGLLTFDRGICSREVLRVLDSGAIRSSVLQPLVDAFKLISCATKVYRDEGWSRHAAHSAVISLCRHVFGRYSSQDATSFVEAALQESLTGSAVPFDDLRDEITNALLRVASPTSIPTGLLSNETSLSAFPHIDKKGIFRLMKDADKLTLFFREFGGYLGGSPSDQVVVNLHLRGEFLRSSHQQGMSEGEIRQMITYLSSPEIDYPREGWCRILEAALSTGQEYFMPAILERLRRFDEPRTAVMVSEVVLYGICRSKWR
jgi:hypothetical protein